MVMEKREIIDQVLALEWNMFDKVQNKGGRAFCQDDYNTFNIMRSSQFLAWNDDMLNSYNADLIKANEEGRNLMTEKYARMMEHTFPEEYKKIKDYLPALSDRQNDLIQYIAGIQVKWMEACAEKYPLIAKRSRYVHASDADNGFASYETYLTGEISTYSVRTLELYRKHVDELLKKGMNMNILILENIIENYGYSSLEQAESYLNTKGSFDDSVQ